VFLPDIGYFDAELGVYFDAELGYTDVVPDAVPREWINRYGADADGERGGRDTEAPGGQAE
jgi:hypothetical protein